MEKEKISFFIATLDSYLSRGKSPDDALRETVKDYAFVFHAPDDGRSLLARASQTVLNRIEAEGG